MIVIGVIHRFACEIMMVVVIVGVDGQRMAKLGSEQGEVLRVLGHRLWLTCAANVVVQAQHLICGCHDQMQIVRN
tara:strand:+ start:3370 stop:3594 length:225 start_codon:yes stop_codon:yes gene_type:complete